MSLSLVPGSFHGDAFHGVQLCNVGKVIPSAGIGKGSYAKSIHAYACFCRLIDTDGLIIHFNYIAFNKFPSLLTFP